MDLRTPFCVFEDTVQGSSFGFFDPQAEICIKESSQILDGLDKIGELQKQGFYLAGFVAYEAGWALVGRPDLCTKKGKSPFLHFFAFKEKADLKNKLETLHIEDEVFLFDFHTNETWDNYKKSLDHIQARLQQGEVYQVNYTYRKTFKFTGNAWGLYSLLKTKQPTRYTAFLNYSNSAILSFSPELFIRKTANQLVTEPMKGTLALEKNPDLLRTDEKSIAENLMIVDLLRNDLGKVANAGSVRADSLFQIQKLKTAYQMTSQVTAEVSPSIEIKEVFAALFPCGSITGAPKLSAMKTIGALETTPRDVYTGAIGYIEPQNDFCFNVAIRTLQIHEDRCSYGVGGGILIDSRAEDEFAECELKSKFIYQCNDSFFLFETILFNGQNLHHQKEHLLRLQKSAHFFGFAFNLVQIEGKLIDACTSLRAPHRLKVILKYDGTIEIEINSVLRPVSDRVVVSKRRVDSKNFFQNHKTSRRKIYDEEYAVYQKSGFYDCLFLNENENLVEASRHNVFLKINDQWVTPPLDSGALPGIERHFALLELPAQERPLFLSDLKKAESIMLTNSLHGRKPVRWSEG